METPEIKLTDTNQILYSPKQVAIASFIGSPVAACWFFAKNYRQLGNPQKATQCLVWGIVGTVVVLFVAFQLPDRFPNQIIPLAYSFGLLQASKRVHGSLVEQHLSAGGKLGSWGVVIGVSFLFLLLVVSLVFGILLLLPGES